MNLDRIREARERIGDSVVATPVVPALALPGGLPFRLHLKLENLQRTGSFKDRGALNRLLQLNAKERARGLVTASAGNHAQAVAYHGQRLGIRVDVVMPTETPLIKVLNTQRFGAGVKFHGSTLHESMEEARRLELEEGRVFVHAYDDAAVIEGQGTIGLELLEQLPDLTAIVVPVGGGGLIAGIALAVKALRPEVRIFGVEAAAAASATASLREGRPLPVESSETIADGIAVKRVGDLNFPIVQKFVDGIVQVEETAIAAAIHLLIEHQKLVAEGAGAVPLAAILAGLLPLRVDDRVAMVLSGGNIDVNLMGRIVDRGRVDDGRLARLSVTVPDRPGNLARLTALVAGAGANVLEVAHARAFADVSVRHVEIAIQIETRSAAHRGEIIARLEREGFSVRRSH